MITDGRKLAGLRSRTPTPAEWEVPILHLSEDGSTPAVGLQVVGTSHVKGARWQFGRVALTCDSGTPSSCYPPLPQCRCCSSNNGWCYGVVPVCQALEVLDAHGSILRTVLRGGYYYDFTLEMWRRRL